MESLLSIMFVGELLKLISTASKGFLKIVLLQSEQLEEAQENLKIVSVLNLVYTKWLKSACVK